ncbi:MAG: hypothetical protein AAF403_01855 [Pseudomonadota bacterium]
MFEIIPQAIAQMDQATYSNISGGTPFDMFSSFGIWPLLISSLSPPTMLALAGWLFWNALKEVRLMIASLQQSIIELQESIERIESQNNKLHTKLINALDKILTETKHTNERLRDDHQHQDDALKRIETKVDKR